MIREALYSPRVPAPVGSYSQALRVGHLVFVSGQVPRTLDGTAQGNLPFELQARLALDNLQAVAKAAGLSLRDAVKVGVYLRDPACQAKAFDAIYAEYVAAPLPARTLVQSNLNGFDIEVDAVLAGH